MEQPFATRVGDLSHAMHHFLAFFQGTYARHTSTPGIHNFAVGNPQELPFPALVDALHRATDPQDKDWYAYKLSEPASQETVANALRDEVGMPFEADDIALTTGAFGALAIATRLLVDPGDEVILNLPPWFFYEALVVAAGGVPVKVPVDHRTFDLDLVAIESAITPRTRAIFVNTPNNPTGKIYPPATLVALATILEQASLRIGRRIYLISDEPYRRINFTGQPFPTPLAYYPYSLMSYSYGKILLAPGERIGYLALPPTMPDRKRMRQAIMVTQVAGGFLFPNAILQHALAELETLSIDLKALRRKRDRMVSALQEIGYEVHEPEGTFYLLPKSPWEDDVAFVDLLAGHGVLCLPGTVTEFPGFFRISLTASEEIIEGSLAGFAAAFEHAQTRPLAASMT